MKKFFQEYGMLALAAIVIVMLVGMASPVGAEMKERVLSLSTSLGGKTNNTVETAMRPNADFIAGGGTENVPTIEGNFVGYYADVDNNGTVDGVIFFDYTQGADTTAGFLGDGVAVSPKTTGLASYELKTVDGKDNVVVKTSDGDDRFYVIALENSKPANGDNSPYWYYSAYSAINDYATLTSTAFGSGKSNTATIKAKWDAEAYGAKNNKDMSTIDMGDWFVPSKDEWSVLGSNLKKVATGTYSSMTFPSGAQIGFDHFGWSSSIYSATDAWYVYFYDGSVFHSAINSTCRARLASTF